MLTKVRHELLMLHFLWLGFKFKSNKNKTYGVKGGTPLRDQRGGRHP